LVTRSLVTVNGMDDDIATADEATDNSEPADDSAVVERGDELDPTAAIDARARPAYRSGRSYRVNVRFSAAELAEVEAAAHGIGVNTSGWCAESALAAARGTSTTQANALDRAAMAGLQRQLFAARTAVNRVGLNLNQAVTALHATGQPPRPALAGAVALCARAVRRLDAVVNEIDGRLR
jgi:hypothetical protein